MDESGGRDGFWVFAYGSLMWRPDFAVAEVRRARLRGYRRAFALHSVHHRGSPTATGLVLGLDWDPGSEVLGLAFRVASDAARAVRATLTARELVTRAYFELVVPVELIEGGTVDAVAYVVDRSHPQYAGAMALEDQAQVIARAVGQSGTNRAYLYAAAQHLAELGLDDPDVATLVARVRALSGD